MRKYNVTVLLAALLLTTACFNDTSEELTPQAAILSCSVGAFNVLHNDVTYDHPDTMVITAVPSGIYKYNIDNANGLIFNTDTLPFGSVINSVATNITSAGTAYYHVPDSNNVYKDVLWTSAAQVDLREPVTIKVISDDKSFTREYTLVTNVYAADPDSMKWETVASLPEGITPANALECNGVMTVLGFDNSSNPCITQYSDNAWSSLSACEGIGPGAEFCSLTVHNGRFAVVENGAVLTSDNCMNWSDIESDEDIVMLIPFRQAGDSGTAWAVTEDGWLASSSDLQHWAKVQRVPDYFPDRNISGVCYRLATNKDIMRFVICGMDESGDETLLWTKLSAESQWYRISSSEDHNLKCPVLSDMSMIRYDGQLYAFGGPMDNFYESRDNGITWRECTSLRETYNTWNNYMQIPKAYKGIQEPFCSAVDSRNVIWFISSDSRGVWKGYINRLHK